MSDLCFCQYAFAQPECRVQDVGTGVDARFPVELLCAGPIAAVISRVGLDQFVPERLQGKTADDIQWLGQIAARHNEIICQAAESSAVLPLRLGTMFRSQDSLLAMLDRYQTTVAQFLEQLGNQQEWGVKLYLKRIRVEPKSAHAGPPPPHFPGSERSGTGYLLQKMAQRDSRREQRAGVNQTVRRVEQCLAGKAGHWRPIRTLPSDLTGRSEEMIFNAAFLLPASEKANWLEAVQNIHREVEECGLALELSGPWPPYHFCPALEL